MTTATRRGRMFTFGFDPRDLAEIHAEALRQDRPPSWLLRVAWRIARDRVAQLAPTREIP